jgi:hypothetical protein
MSIMQAEIINKLTCVISEWTKNPSPCNFQIEALVSQPPIMPQSNKEAKNILALKAYENDPELGLHRASEIYQASYGSLWRRTHGIPSRHDAVPKSRKLANLEEQVVIRFILALY